MIVHGNGYGSGYGLIGCEEWRILKGRLELLLSQAEKAGLTSAGPYVVAKKYYDDNTGFFGAPVVMFGAACEKEVQEINAVISGLSAAISGSGATPIFVGPTIEPEEGPLAQIPGLIKWLAIGAIAVSAAITVATVVPRFFGKKRGYGDPFDPEQRDLEGISRRRPRRRRRVQ